MKFVGLLSLVCVFCIAVTFFSPEVDASKSKIRKIKIAKKVAKLLLLRGATKPRVLLAIPVPLPVPIPRIVRKTVHSPVSSSWDSAPHSYEFPSLHNLPESIINLLRPALSTIATSALKSSSAWPAAPQIDSAWNAWPSVSQVESWGSPAQNSAPVQQQQQQEVVEQQQTNNYA